MSADAEPMLTPELFEALSYATNRPEIDGIVAHWSTPPDVAYRVETTEGVFVVVHPEVLDQLPRHEGTALWGIPIYRTLPGEVIIDWSA